MPKDLFGEPLHWNVKIVNKDGKVVNTSLFDNFAIAYNNQVKDSRWKFEDYTAKNPREYNYMELHRFGRKNVTNHSELNLTNYKIHIDHGSEGAPSFMQLQVGSYSMMGKKLRKVKGKPQVFEFDLSDSKIAGFLLGKWNKDDGTKNIGTRNITIQPYYNDRKHFGSDSLVLSFGPQHYSSSFSGKLQARTINTQTLANPGMSTIKVNGKTYQYQIGALANDILKQNAANQNKNIIVSINGHGKDNYIDQSKLLLSQYVVFREVKAKLDSKDWKRVGVGFDKQIAVIGATNTKSLPLISGLTNSLKPNFGGHEYSKFKNGMLEVFSSYSGPGKSIKIKGIQFGDAPQRNEGTVRANANYNPIVKFQTWFRPSDKSPNVVRDRLKRIIAEATSANPDFYNWGNGATKNSVLFQDNQFVAWATASDGLESHSPQLVQNKNFYLINDDILKVGASDGIFKEITMHDGPSGSAISLGNYGYSNGPINDNVIEPYIHRTVQPYGNPGDVFGGTIANRTYWNSNLLAPAGSGKKNGINNNTFNNFYIPRMKNVKGLNANQLYREGIISAETRPDRYNLFAGALVAKVQNGASYNAGGYVFNNYQNNLASSKTNFIAAWDRNYGDFWLPQNGTSEWWGIGRKNSNPANESITQSKMDMFDTNFQALNQRQTVNVYGITYYNNTNQDVAKYQGDATDALLDLSTVVPSSYVELQLDIETNSSFQNKLYLIECDIVTGFKYIGGVKVEDSSNFRDAVKDEITGSSSILVGTYGGEGKSYRETLTITSAESAIYALALMNPLGEVFTIGATSSYGFDNVRVKDGLINSFYFEDQKGLGDVDRNDLIVNATVV